MRGFARILIVLLIAAALPLRGYVAIAAELCGGHHAGDQPAQVADHDHHATGEQAGHDHDPSSASICSHCASCSVGASLAPDSGQHVAVFISRSDRIPFVDTHRPAHVPDRLDRPPLVS